MFSVCAICVKQILKALILYCFKNALKCILRRFKHGNIKSLTHNVQSYYSAFSRFMAIYRRLEAVEFSTEKIMFYL